MDVPVLGKRLNEYRNEFRIPADMEYSNILSSGADTSDRTDYGMFSRAYLRLQPPRFIRDKPEPGLGNGDSLATKAYLTSDLAQRRRVLA